MKKQRDLISTTRHGNMSESTDRNKKVGGENLLIVQFSRKGKRTEIHNLTDQSQKVSYMIDKYYRNIGFVETLSFQQMVKHLFTEGIVPIPPNCPFALRSEVIVPWGVPQRRGEALHTVAPQRALRKIF